MHSRKSRLLTAAHSKKMAISYRHKRKATTGYVWQTADLADGEIGVNTADGTLHLKKTDNTIQAIKTGVDSPTVFQIVTLTQAAYDALPTPDANTLYLITV